MTGTSFKDTVIGIAVFVGLAIAGGLAYISLVGNWNAEVDSVTIQRCSTPGNYPCFTGNSRGDYRIYTSSDRWVMVRRGK